MQRNLRIYLLHFFLNFLCGMLFCFGGMPMIAIVFKGTISELTQAVVFYGFFLNILIATIIVNIISFINFKKSKCNPVTCLILACVGLVMPYSLFLFN